VGEHQLRRHEGHCMQVLRGGHSHTLPGWCVASCHAQHQAVCAHGHRRTIHVARYRIQRQRRVVRVRAGAPLYTAVCGVRCSCICTHHPPVATATVAPRGAVPVVSTACPGAACTTPPACVQPQLPRPLRPLQSICQIYSVGCGGAWWVVVWDALTVVERQLQQRCTGER
jgi:hypothetical protein